MVGGSLVFYGVASRPELFFPQGTPPGEEEGEGEQLSPEASIVPPVTKGGDSYGTIIEIAETIGPAVVGVSTRRQAYDWFWGAYEIPGVGSGVIFDPEGYILTNDHVVHGARTITVTLYDGRQVQGELVGTDPSTDLAVVKINETNLPVAPLGDSDNLRVGELAVAIGNPLGLELQRTVTAGIISALNRTIQTEDGNVLEGLIQTDASINPGNSGGPLVNGSGQVIGINTAKATQAEGIGFAIPINVAKPIVEELIAHGRIITPWLGIIGGTVTREIATYYNLPVEKGVLVAEVIPDSPAAEAGLRQGDVITAFNLITIETIDDLTGALEKAKVGERVQLTVVRQGNRLTIPVILGERPQE
ncbi:MAG TPA: PDZ domain-containing protein [Firmicutes bacterium]|nr:PDZ domain-containing protein [Bacillota bacterium]